MGTGIKNLRDIEFKTIREAVQAYIAPSNYGGGELEKLWEEVNNCNRCIANIVEVLVEKKIITKKEVKEEILDGLWA